MNVTLYGQMLEEVKRELADSQLAREELDTLFAIWRNRMVGHANYDAVLQDVFQTQNFHQGEARDLEKLCNYLAERLARQGEPEHVVEFGKNGDPLNTVEPSAEPTRVPPKALANDSITAAQQPMTFYKFGPQGFAWGNAGKTSSRETSVKPANEEALLEFAEFKGDRTIHFDANGNPLSEYLAEGNHQATVSASA